MDYYTIPTKIGAAKLSNAALLGQKLEITQVVFGDSGGEEYEPSGDETALVNQTYSTPPNDISAVDGADVYIQIQAIVPSNVGGWYLREIGCYDADGDLIFIGNIPPTYKPSGDQSVVKDLDFKVVYNATAADNVTIKIDNTEVIATRSYANRMDADTLEKAKAYADSQDSDLKAYVDTQDKAGQTAAKSDATKKANQALAEAKTYAENAGNLKSGTVASERLPEATTEKIGGVKRETDANAKAGTGSNVPSVAQIVAMLREHGLYATCHYSKATDFNDIEDSGNFLLNGLVANAPDDRDPVRGWQLYVKRGVYANNIDPSDNIRQHLVDIHTREEWVRYKRNTGQWDTQWTKFLTETDVISLGLGFGGNDYQYQDVSDSHEEGVWYPNTTGKTLYVAVGTTSAATSGMELLLRETGDDNSMTIDTGSHVSNFIDSSVSGFINEGFEYQVIGAGQGITFWVEYSV